MRKSRERSNRKKQRNVWQTMRREKMKCTHSYRRTSNCNVVIWNGMLFNQTERSRQRKPKNLCGSNVSTHNFTRVFLYLTVFYCVPLFVVRFRGQYDLRPQMPQHCALILTARPMCTTQCSLCADAF